jgi:hypothetical protein
MKDEMIAYDMNFSKFPTYIVDAREAYKSKNYEFKRIDGYLLKAYYRVPTDTDYPILMYFVLMSQNNGWCDTVKTTIYDVLKSCNMGTSGRDYLRLKESLKRWKSVTVDFKGTFYDRKNYKTLHFNMIDSWRITSESVLEVRLSKEWLLVLENSSFVNYLNFNNLLRLKSALSMRLYELLLNHIVRQKKWIICNDKLAPKLTLKSSSPSIMIPKMKNAVKEINEKTDMEISLKIQRLKRGEAKFFFERERQRKPNPKKPERIVNGTGLIDVIKYQRDRTERAESLLLEYSKKFNYNYVNKNIEYTNHRARGNYYGYLVLALENNYANAAIPRKKEKRPIRPPRTCKCGGEVRPWEMLSHGADQLVEYRNAKCVVCKQVYINTEEGWKVE